MPDDLIGQVIDGYAILSRLGQGGMATVYRAQQQSMNRAVAFKILPQHFLRDDTYLQRFQREVDIVARLEHRSIVPVYDYGEHDGRPYIAMRYMPGGSIDDMLNRANGPLPLETIVSLVGQVAPALDYAHSKGVLHRDLKPSNILLDDDGGAYLTDFGIARLTGGEGKVMTTITTQGVVGTPAYMSPEQAQGKPLDGRSDVYALGIMLFEMATGRRPFENDTPYGIAVMQVTTPPPSPRVFNPKLTGAVEQVIFKALKKMPDNRYRTAVELAEALKLAVEQPERFSDTQPRPLPIREALDLTQPSGAEPQDAFNEPTVRSTVQPAPRPPSNPSPVATQQRAATPAPSPGMQPPVYAPPQMTPPPSRSMHPVRRRRRGGMWGSILLGALLGCGLLALVVAGAAVAIGSLLDNGDSAPPTAPPANDAGLGVDPLDPTSAAAATERSSGAAAGTQTDAAPTPTLIPVGQRVGTPTPGFVALSGTLLYFDERPLPGATAGDDGDLPTSFDLFRLDLATGQETRLTDDPAVDSYPVASPDGTRIAFQSDRDGDFEIYVMDADGGDVQRLTTNRVLDRLPGWSPDGAWIVYSSDTRDDGTLDLYRVPVTGGEPQRVFSNGQRNSHPRYSPDGRYIVFTSGDPNNASTWNIARLDTFTGDVVLLTTGGGREASPSYSPDGDTIIYARSGDGVAGLGMMAANGQGATMLYDSPALEGGGYFSPDGRYIVADAQTGAESVLVILTADGDEVQPVDAVEGGFYPSWIP